jgi:Cof subfamily protein (haloacid dehalogenase superfamily)
MIRILLTDIDNTLLSHHQNRIPLSSVYALNQLKQKGIIVAGCTGRHPLELSRLNLAGFEPDAMIYLNGALCMEKDRIIREKPHSAATMAKLKDWLVEHPVPVQFMEQDYIYDNMISDEMKEELAGVHTPLDPIDSLDRLDEHAVDMFIPWTDETTRAELADMLDVKALTWGLASDMVRKDAGKDAGVQDLLDYYHLKKEEAMCFGDGQNDIAMFAACGLSICMGNGIETAREAADEVTERIDEDGLYHALVRHGLIEKKDGISAITN